MDKRSDKEGDAGIFEEDGEAGILPGVPVVFFLPGVVIFLVLDILDGVPAVLAG